MGRANARVVAVRRSPGVNNRFLHTLPSSWRLSLREARNCHSADG